MITAKYNFEGNRVKYYFEQSIKGMDSYCHPETTLVITDRNLYNHYKNFLQNRKLIVLEPGEDAKQLASVNRLLEQMEEMGVTKNWFIVGMGGGVVTDITGFVASIYMRGLPCAFIPTSLLAMIDAALGGKNGVNSARHKNIFGTIYPPQWLIFDRTLLYTLPQNEWTNGFAEAIKYGAILNPLLLDMFEQYTPAEIQDKHYLTARLLYICTHAKSLVVEEDLHDTGNRRLLNFGHTIGHAIEKIENRPHGQAVAMGMVAECRLAEKLNGFPAEQTEKLKGLLEKYNLPVQLNATTSREEIASRILFDKKREATHIHLAIPATLGKGTVIPVPVSQLTELIHAL